MHPLSSMLLVSIGQQQVQLGQHVTLVQSHAGQVRRFRLAGSDAPLLLLLVR
jgi:hypothetical protein